MTSKRRDLIYRLIPRHEISKLWLISKNQTYFILTCFYTGLHSYKIFQSSWIICCTPIFSLKNIRQKRRVLTGHSFAIYKSPKGCNFVKDTYLLFLTSSWKFACRQNNWEHGYSPFPKKSDEHTLFSISRVEMLLHFE